VPHKTPYPTMLCDDDKLLTKVIEALRPTPWPGADCWVEALVPGAPPTAKAVVKKAAKAAVKKAAKAAVNKAAKGKKR
jgi:hypothetical protein